jgi:hypothetical protein
VASFAQSLSTVYSPFRIVGAAFDMRPTPPADPVFSISNTGNVAIGKIGSTCTLTLNGESITAGGDGDSYWDNTDNVISPVSGVISVDTPALTIEHVPVSKIYYAGLESAPFVDLKVGDSLTGATLNFTGTPSASTLGYMTIMLSTAQTGGTATGMILIQDGGVGIGQFTFQPVGGTDIYRPINWRMGIS